MIGRRSTLLQTQTFRNCQNFKKNSTRQISRNSPRWRSHLKKTTFFSENPPSFPGKTDRPSEPHVGRGHIWADGNRPPKRHRPCDPWRSLRRCEGPSVSVWLREVRRWSLAMLTPFPQQSGGKMHLFTGQLLDLCSLHSSESLVNEITWMVREEKQGEVWKCED